MENKIKFKVYRKQKYYQHLYTRSPTFKCLQLKFLFLHCQVSLHLTKITVHNNYERFKKIYIL